MRGWRLLLTVVYAGVVGSVTTILVAAWLDRMDTAWMGDDYAPGCRVIRTLVVFDRTTGQPSHEAQVVTCPPDVLRAIESGRRMP